VADGDVEVVPLYIDVPSSPLRGALGELDDCETGAGVIPH